MAFRAGELSQELIFLRRPVPIQEDTSFSLFWFENHLVLPQEGAEPREFLGRS